MSIEKRIKKDLFSLYKQNFIQSAKELNKSLGKRYFSDKLEPMFFTGDLESKIVLIMLNPGNGNKKYDFKKEKGHKFTKFSDYFNNYIREHKIFGTINKEKLDQFDLKQAAFMLGFDSKFIKIDNYFWKSKEKKIKAKENVLNNKLQIEFIPYASSRFENLFTSKTNSKMHEKIFFDFTNALMEFIFSRERENVIFCSNIFAKLFEANTNKKFKFTLHERKKFSLSRFNCHAQKVIIQFKNVKKEVLIANSFPHRALTNAYVLMKKYGKFCRKCLV